MLLAKVLAHAAILVKSKVFGLGNLANKMAGLLLCAITALIVCKEWSIAEWTQPAKPFLVLALVSIFLFKVTVSRKALIAVAGQIGMNPILHATLVAPLVPAAADLGVQPTSIVVAFTSGWALSGASSPFTATTLLIGSYAGIRATRVGLVWNGAYTIICSVAFYLWVVAFAWSALTLFRLGVMILFRRGLHGHTEPADAVYDDLYGHARFDRACTDRGAASDEITGVERHVL